MITQLQSYASGDADSDEPAGSMAFSACRLSTAHLAIALVAVLVIIGSVGLWPAVEAGGHPLEVDTPAHEVAWAALAYLVVTALAEFRAGWQLDHQQRASASAAPRRLLAHVLVLIAAVVVLARGFHSLSLLAGLYIILPGLATVSLLTLIAGIVERNTLRRADDNAGLRAEPAKSAQPLIWLALQWVAALLLIGALFYLEEQPLPHGRPSVLVETPAEAGESGTGLPGNLPPRRYPR